MSLNIKIMTHESIVHSQLNSIERILNRQVDFKLTLNIKGIKSNIEFVATPDEVEKVKRDLGYTVFTLVGKEWQRNDNLEIDQP